MQSPSDNAYRSIIVPLDGSEFAEHALRPAASIARRHGAMLHIVRVYVPVAGICGERAVRYDRALDLELMTQAKTYLRGVVTRLTEVEGVQAREALLEGWIEHAITQHATSVGAGLIVMTTHGRGPLARFWLGSVADQLVRQPGIPILFVRSQPSAAEAESDPLFRRVLVPLDDSPLAQRVLESVFALDQTSEREYTLLQVTTPLETTYGPAGGEVTGFRQALEQSEKRSRELVVEAKQYLEHLAGSWRKRGFKVETAVLSHQLPAAAILEDASTRQIDLIALATHGRGLWKRLMLGSVADKVVRGAEAAVLVFRPDAEPTPTPAG